ncbi:MAG: hypothetical protein E7373_04085 [Clostridiales bacterium]|nr:hypothetical protein [Clostridiales bacterium]
MINYFYDCYMILNKVYSEKTFIKQAISSTFIEEKNRALIIKTCYGVLDKDIELSYYLKALTEKSPKLVIRTILKIAMYSIKYLQKKEYAVTKNAVELTKKLGKGGMSGFVNAFLRKFINTEIAMPKEKTEYLSVKYSYPEFAVRELVKSYGYDRTENIISATNENTCLVFYDIDGENYLKNKGYEYSKTPFDNVFIVKNFTRNEDYDKGLYTYQALGSVAICEEVEGCENLLDTCAAPGGKSIRLSYKCKKVTSWDIHEHRVALIEDYKKRMHRENVYAFVKDAKVKDENLKDKFDAVLVDAPCSGLGVLNDNPDIRLNRCENDIISLNKEQLSILKCVSNYVKKGGYLYYSTCSVLDSENIAIIKAFMSDIKGFELCKLNSKLQHETYFGTNQFLPDISGGLGFYVAKLKRVE